ncbi:MAG: hypothetical protein ACEPO8_14820 [Rhodothermaceae bacterium]
MSKNKNKYIIQLLTGLLMILAVSCEMDTKTARPNLPPNTTIANIPIDDSTYFALLTLHWDGEDYDGFVPHYEYSYTTYNITTGDSVTHDWVKTEKTSMSIPFQSENELNKQKFMVRAVDNEGQPDPEPAQKIFYTTKSHPPAVQIISPKQNKKYLGLSAASDWWPGVTLLYKGTDQDQFHGDKVVEYAWKIDSKEFEWTKDSLIVITPDMMDTPIDGEHTVKVIARDKTNLISADTSTVTFELQFPQFNKEVLVIDATDENVWLNGLEDATDNDVDNFYRDLYPGCDEWDLNYYGKLPSLEELGQYKTIVWHADNYPASKPKYAIGDFTDEIANYMNIGGNLIVSGWRILKTFDWTGWGNEPVTEFEPNSFIYKYLHINVAQETGFFGDLTKAIGVQGFNDLHVDAQKLPGFTYGGKLSYVNLIKRTGGFTGKIYIYDNPADSNTPEYRGQTVGLRYYGTSFQSVVLCFPLYFMEKEDAKSMVQNVLKSFEEN